MMSENSSVFPQRDKTKFKGTLLGMNITNRFWYTDLGVNATGIIELRFPREQSYTGIFSSICACVTL